MKKMIPIFYPEKIDDDGLKESSKWLSDINGEEIKSNFNSLS